jgi:peptidoglycan/LPS O-acetylase OafA/YrhL
MAGDEQKGAAHLPALDGIRGLAILLVVIFHFTVFAHMTADTLGERVYRGLFIAGWSGVDLFFVLSGFLITGILLDTKETRHYFRNFYARRFLRIFPLYYTALVILLWGFPLACPRLARPTDFSESLWYWAYVSNVRAAFGGWSNTVVDHFWSLAIEEQFYLVWPLAIFFAPRRSIPILCAIVLVVAPILRTILVVRHYGLAAYTLTPCRADALAAGGFVAYLVRSELTRDRLGRLSRVVFLVSAAALATLCAARHGLHFEDPIISTVGFSFIASMYAALVAATFLAPDRGALRRLFEARALRTLGKYSYGVYVFHQPLAAMMERAGWVFPRLPRTFGSHLVTEIAVTVAGGGLSLALAAASWHLFEERFLRLKKNFTTSAETADDRPRRSLPSAVV